MKLTIVLLTVAFLKVSANGFSQNISFAGENVKLTSVFTAIKQQTGYVVFGSIDLLKKARPVTLNVRNLPLTALLDTIFKEQPIRYTISARTIILSHRSMSGKKNHSGGAQSVPPRVSDVLVENDDLVTGRIFDSTGIPLAGASVAVRGNNTVAVTDAQGAFKIVAKKGDVLVVSYVGFEEATYRVVDMAQPIYIRLAPQVIAMDKVAVVVNTGYQRIPRERAAGSFFTVDKELIDRRVSTNILQRLEDYVPGLIFQRDYELPPGEEGNTISIRGTTTIRSENAPLIVVDNFPYDGDIKNINPNDVENITILRDASAASIWGARAGNGVIVITTKSGRFNSKLNLGVNANVSFGSRPDAFHFPQMSMNDYVDAIETLFNNGNFQFPTIRYNTVIPPLMQTLLNRRDGVISDAVATEQLNEFKRQDIRRDITKYFYQSPVNSQVSLNLSGGSEKHNFAVNAGFDDNKLYMVSNQYKRMNLEAKNSFRLLQNRLEIATGINIIRTVDETGNNGAPREGLINIVDRGMFPYTRLVDDQGNHLPVSLNNTGFIENAMANGLKDWFYYPVKEIGLSPRVRDGSDYRLNANVAYTILPGLKIEGLYQYWRNMANAEQLFPLESYTVRNLINTSTTVNPDGTLSSPIPAGDILDLNTSVGYSHSLRGQLHFTRKFGRRHEINFLAGAEMRDQQSISRITRYYGYDDVLGINASVDYLGRYNNYWTGANTITIFPNTSHDGTINRFLSQYGNASYTWNSQLTFTGSFRRDASNIFGVETNNRVKPLWSAGASWQISNASFYKSDLLPLLKLRMSYGYNGNVNNTIAAFLTASYLPASYNVSFFGPNAPYVNITNPPNPMLRWEKVEITNLGLDFGFRNNRVSGSLEGYIKRGTDLIGAEVFPPSSGVTSFQGNFANTRSWGLDLMLNTVNIRSGSVLWKTDLNFSYVNEKVTRFGQKPSPSMIRLYGNGRSSPGNTPVVGRPLQGVYAYHWAGLDPENGDPMGYLDDKASSDYVALLNYYDDAEKFYYAGTGRPPLFGALRNTFSWKGLSLSANVSFRLGYVIKRPEVNYRALTSAPYRATTDDYSRRWQEPGDEQWTDVPSFRPEQTATIASNRQTFYNFSSALIEKGDHVRLQDVMMSYRFPKNSRTPLKGMELYVHANNLGIIWKASDKVKDPDYRNYLAPVRTVAFGIRVNY